MPAAWPAAVNQFAYRAGYGEQAERNVVSFQPEVGPPIERRRSTVATDIITFEGRGTPAEWASLKSFYRVTLRDGVDTFTRNHPLTGQAGTFKFTAPPRLIRVGATLLRYELQMRQLP